jgi:hypothetical protein
MPQHHAVVDSGHHFRKNSVGRSRKKKAGIETVAFIPANAFSMKIQTNMVEKKGIKVAGQVGPD